MMKLKRAALARVAAGGLVLGSMLIAGPASADTLLDLTNLPDQNNASYSFLYTPTTNMTQLSFSGFNSPSVTYVGDIFFGAGATNLNQDNWILIPGSAPAASQDGGYLYFAGVNPSSYDTFTQNFSTTPGTRYNLRFQLSSYGTPSGFKVSASSLAAGPGAPAPEVGIGLLSALIAGFGLALTRMRSNPFAGLLNRRRAAFA